MEEIVIRVGKDGKINLAVAGIKGGACKNVTAALEKALGIAEKTETTDEYYQQPQTLEDQQSQGQ
jgi:hypothetical protein